MKKLLSIAVCILLSCMLLACGNTSKPAKADKSPKIESKKSDDSKKSITSEYKGLSFEIPSESEYDAESDSSAIITFEPQKKIVTIIPTDTSSLNQGLSGSWNDLSITSILDGFEEVQNRKDSETTLSGLPAKEVTCMVKLSGSWFSYNIIAVVSEDYDYQYSICYATSEDAGTDNSAYESFIKSISFK